MSPRAFDAVAATLMHRVELHGDGAEVTLGTVLEPTDVVGDVTGGWRGRGRGMVMPVLAGIAVLAAVVLRRTAASGHAAVVSQRNPSA